MVFHYKDYGGDLWKYQKHLLIGFYKQTIGEARNRWTKDKRYFTKEAREKKLKLLKEYAKFRFVFKNGMQTIDKRRHFNDIKTDRYKNYTKRFCFICKSKKTIHRHHIISLKNGGYNSRRNIIPLCENCHMEIHPFMRKIKERRLEQDDIFLAVVLSNNRRKEKSY